MTFVDKRKQIKIFVTPEAKKVVEDYKEASDIAEQAIASRVYEWFGQQTEHVRRAALGMVIDADDVEKARQGFRPLDLRMMRGERPHEIGHIREGNHVEIKDLKPKRR